MGKRRYLSGLSTLADNHAAFSSYLAESLLMCVFRFNVMAHMFFVLMSCMHQRQPDLTAPCGMPSFTHKDYFRFYFL